MRSGGQRGMSRFTNTLAYYGTIIPSTQLFGPERTPMNLEYDKETKFSIWKIGGSSVNFHYYLAPAAATIGDVLALFKSTSPSVTFNYFEKIYGSNTVMKETVSGCKCKCS